MRVHNGFKSDKGVRKGITIMSKVKSVVAYLRVSTDEQDTGSQIEAIKRYCSNQSWTLKKVYEDKGVSGAIDDRPALNQLKKDCTDSKFQAVLVFRFDRLARSTSHLLECLQLFNRYGIDFVSVSEGVDTTTAIGKMIFTFLSAISEFEREIIRERVKAGVSRAQAEGKHCGRPRKGFDYAEVINLHKQGWSLRRIAEKQGVSYVTIYRTIKGVTKTLKNSSPE